MIEIHVPLSPQKPSLLHGTADRQQRQQARPPDPNGLTLPEPIQSEIDLVHVLHHLPELLGLHQSRGGRNRRPATVIDHLRLPIPGPPRFLGPPNNAVYRIVERGPRIKPVRVGVGGPVVGGRFLGREAETGVETEAVLLGAVF